MLDSSLLSLNTTLPEYHDHLLIVRARTAPAALQPGALSTARGGGVSPAGVDAVLSDAAAPGYRELAYLERAGKVRRVTPLSRAAPTDGAPPVAFAATATVAAAAVAGAAEDAGGTGRGAGGAPRAAALDGASVLEFASETDTKQAQNALAQDPNFDVVAQVPVRYLFLPPALPAAIPPPAASMWNLQRIGWQQAVAAGLPLAGGVKVAVLDTGVDFQHPDLPPDLNYVFSYADPPVGTSDKDLAGHGTHVAGTIRALATNAVGINGICECDLGVYKIFDDTPDLFPMPFGPRFLYAVNPVLYRRALAVCLDDGVRVINLSIGGYGKPDPVEAALFAELVADDVVIVAAMGNDNTGQAAFPAAIPGVIAVGATTLNDKRAAFSNFGGHIALCAPGEAIWSTMPIYPGQNGFVAQPDGSGGFVPGAALARETDYAALRGTSMASPHVAAAAAMALAKHGAMSPKAMKTLLMQATDAVAGMNGAAFAPEFGAGRLNLTKI